MSLSHVTYREKDGDTDGSVMLIESTTLKIKMKMINSTTLKSSISLQRSHRSASVSAAEDQTALTGVMQ